MRLKLIVSPDMGENCYFVIDENTNDAIVIDPGAEGSRLINIVKNEDLKVKAICLTHCHFDHSGAAKELSKFTNAPVLICENEEVIAESEINNLSAMFGNGFTVDYDRVLKDGEHFKFGNLEFKTILTPGHTPGSCSFYFEKEGVLFSGDTLFYMSLGRCDFPLGSSNDIISSIKNKLFTLPDDTVVYCGHNNNTTIGFEKANNPYIY
ncbi:MAG: MBL fold metallo-hydrolase [Lachnospirales bacterium]